MAFQEFSGAPLKVTDAAEELTQAELDSVEKFLRKLVYIYKKYEIDLCPE
jgi:hypothetical protein